MLNLFTSNFISKKDKELEYNEFRKKSFKHFPSSVREWNNSTYYYNKNSVNLLPNNSIIANKLLKSFFTLFNRFIEKKIRVKNLRSKFRKLSSNKIFVSNGEFKHTNNKVIIVLYIYNRQRHNLIFNIRKKYLNTLFNIKSKKNIKFNSSLIKKLNTIRDRSLNCLKNINAEKYIIVKALSNQDAGMYSISNYIDGYYNRFINKSFKRLKLFLFYKQILLLNKFKYNYNFLQYLKPFLYELYNKNIEFNLVNLKRFYLNSDIMSESLLLKLTKNRRKILKYLTKLRNKVKINNKSILSSTFLPGDRLLKKNNLTLNETILKNTITNNIKFKYVSGFRIEAKGRLSKRYTASRSLSKTKYKGNLLNIDSSFRGLSSVLLKGNLKSNIQNTKLKSKSRIGSFGIKGWISGN